jgi:hypothetical protein
MACFGKSGKWPVSPSGSREISHDASVALTALVILPTCHISRSVKEAIMLNPTSLLADALGRSLTETYRRIYGDQEPRMAHALDEAARLVIERIAGSDALYHDCEHTALVTLCVQDILRGRRLERTITPSDWGHTILAALNHDIGYVRGICAGDTAEHFVIDAAGNTVTPPRGASDAFLTPYHVERGRLRSGSVSSPFPTSMRSASPTPSSSRVSQCRTTKTTPLPTPKRA